ncbi:c-type cytochrome [Pseudoroseicyclus sp. CXY001]|uniref:c-type cytochrome n=1 Tax=Pseudoroseicyclus sp. CXY001 TaxID=3242492 RepID=UPI003570BE59
MKRILATLALPALLSACIEGPEEVDGATFYETNCAACHGPTGHGDGELAEGLPVPPADLTQLSAMNGGVFPRDQVMSYVDGYHRGGLYAEVMPEFGAGDLGPTVIVEDEAGVGTPVPAALLAVANYLAGIQE